MCDKSENTQSIISFKQTTRSYGSYYTQEKQDRSLYRKQSSETLSLSVPFLSSRNLEGGSLNDKVLGLKTFVELASNFNHTISVENTHSCMPYPFYSLRLFPNIISLNLLNMSNEPIDVHIYQQRSISTLYFH